jgi:hypothetical protein
MPLAFQKTGHTLVQRVSFFVGGESVLMDKALHRQMLSSVDVLRLLACSSLVKSSLLFYNALRHAETYFLLITCSLYKLHVNLDWCYCLCMQEPKHISRLHSGPTFHSCDHCLCFNCLHLLKLQWHLAVTFSIIMHMLTHAQPWHVAEFVTSLSVA